MAYKIKTSLYGRKLGFSTSDHLVDKDGARFDVGKINTNISSSGATISNNGVTSINSTGTAVNLTMQAPVEGCRAELAFITSASLVTIQAPSSTVTFGTSSTAFSLTSSAGLGLKNYSLTLRGLGSTAYAIFGGYSTGPQAVMG